jgi:hypothetical protein
MESIIIICQIIIALGIYNVWILRYSKSTDWRGGMAKNMKEEFEVYGFPGWFVKVIGFFKLLFATFLIGGLFFPVLTKPAAAGMAILMLGAVLMHFKVKDPVKKSLPALTLLVLSLIVAFS